MTYWNLITLVSTEDGVLSLYRSMIDNLQKTGWVEEGNVKFFAHFAPRKEKRHGACRRYDLSVEFNHARRQAMSNPIVSFDEQAVKDELRDLVRKTIEETINAMLDEEADQLVGAGPYERTDERAAYRAGHYERGSTTTSGQVALRMPKLKGMRFATAVVERYKRRETSVEEAIIEMHPARASTRRIEDVGEILWGAGVSAGTVSNLNDKAF